MMRVAKSFSLENRSRLHSSASKPPETNTQCAQHMAWFSIAALAKAVQSPIISKTVYLTACSLGLLKRLIF